MSDSITSFRWTFPDEYQEFLFCLLKEATVKRSHWGHTTPFACPVSIDPPGDTTVPKMTLWEGFALALLLSLKPNLLLVFGSPHPTPDSPGPAPNQRDHTEIWVLGGSFLKGWC